MKDKRNLIAEHLAEVFDECDIRPLSTRAADVVAYFREFSLDDRMAFVRSIVDFTDMSLPRSPSTEVWRTATSSDDVPFCLTLDASKR